MILAQLLVYPQLCKLGLRNSSILICAMQVRCLLYLSTLQPLSCFSSALSPVHLPLTSDCICLLQIPFQVALPFAGVVEDNVWRYRAVAVLLCLKCGWIEMFCTSRALMLNKQCLTSSA